MQVCMHEYGAYDINTSNIWIKIQLSEEVSNPLERIKIRDRMFDILCQWFIDTGYYVPYDFALDIIWGPTSGCIHTADQNYSW